MAAQISQNSRRVAKNTLLLYLRMLLLMGIGLYTSRVILKALGVEDFGTYTAVYEMVMIFTIVSNSISNAISRFMAYEIGKGSLERQRKVFSSAIIIQTGLSALIVLLTASLGLWYLYHGLVIPADRKDAALWVMICTAGLLIVQLYSIPFNATIIAAEDIKAFAYISILEAALKLCIAFAISRTQADRLVTYAVLMLAVGLVIRSTYAVYCRRHCPQSTGGIRFDRDIIREMLGFSGWSFLGNGVSVMSTKGVSMLANGFFGVGVNAARGIAVQVENIVKQFVSNFLTALNPQITKSWAAGNREYCYELVGKGCKFSMLTILFFAVPFAFEADAVLGLWLAQVPQWAASFTRLTLFCLLAEMGVNSIFQLVMATGRVSGYYIITSCITASGFILSWVVFAMGCGPAASYLAILAAMAAADIAKIAIARRIAGFPVLDFVRGIIIPVFFAGVAGTAACIPAYLWMEESTARLFINAAASVSVMAAYSYFMVLTAGERDFAKETLAKLWKKKFWL